MSQTDIPAKMPSGEKGAWVRLLITGVISGALSVGVYAVSEARHAERQALRLDALEISVQHTLVPAVAALKTDAAVQARENQVLREGIARLEASLREVAADVKALRGK